MYYIRFILLINDTNRYYLSAGGLLFRNHTVFRSQNFAPQLTAVSVPSNTCN